MGEVVGAVVGGFGFRGFLAGALMGRYGLPVFGLMARLFRGRVLLTRNSFPVSGLMMMVRRTIRVLVLW